MNNTVKKMAPNAPQPLVLDIPATQFYTAYGGSASQKALGVIISVLVTSNITAPEHFSKSGIPVPIENLRCATLILASLTVT